MMASMVCASSTSRFSSSFWGCALCRSHSSSSSFVKLSSEIAMPGLGHQSLGMSLLLQPEECFQIIDHASPFWAHGFPLHFVFNFATTASLKASLHHATTAFKLVILMQFRTGKMDNLCTWVWHVVQFLELAQTRVPIFTPFSGMGACHRL